MAITLPPDYYLDNFKHLLGFVAERYWPLLCPSEQAYFQRFEALPQASQMLYVRLLTRRGEFFLLKKLHYGEIGDIAAAAEPLAEQGLLEIQPDLSLEQTLPLLTKATIATRLDRKPLANLSRPDLERQLLAQSEQHAAMVKALCADEIIYRALEKTQFTTFQLCFFGNLRQDLTDYVLRDLGLQRYENYPLERDQLLFESREQIEGHLSFYQQLENLDHALASDCRTIEAFWHSLPDKAAADPVLARRIERVGINLARQLERLDAKQQALAIYQSIRRPPARERRARILVSEGDIETGLALCRQIASQPQNEEERSFAQSFGYRQAKKHGIDWPAPSKHQPPSENITLHRSDQQVEIAVAQYLAAEGNCYFVENALLNSVLGLAIWDIVFAPLRGVFFNPFQQAPADFYDTAFVERRHDSLQQRLGQLADAAFLSATVWHNFREKAGLANPLVNWSVVDEALLQQALECIPANQWHVMLQRLLADLRHHRSGMPDLIHFPATGGYQWVEVKGPGDRLQKNQQRWLAFFADQGIPHRVIYVAWQDDVSSQAVS